MCLQWREKGDEIEAEDGGEEPVLSWSVRRDSVADAVTSAQGY